MDLFFSRKCYIYSSKYISTSFHHWFKERIEVTVLVTNNLNSALLSPAKNVWIKLLYTILKNTIEGTVLTLLEEELAFTKFVRLLKLQESGTRL